MKQIPLTQGRVARVDDEDYAFLLDMGTWCYSTSGYALHYGRKEDGSRTTVSQHRTVIRRRLIEN